MRVSTSKAYKYVYKTSRVSDYTGFISSLIIHIIILLFLLLRQSVSAVSSTLSVTVIEEEVKREKKKEIKREIERKEEKPGPEIRHKPNLFAAIQRTIEKPPPININLKTQIEAPKIKISQQLPLEPGPIVPIKNIEIKSVTEEIGPQAKIDLKSLESGESGIGGEIVVGQGASTSEILKRPAYKPTVDISRAVAESGIGRGGIAPWGPGGGSGEKGGKVELKVKAEEPPPPAPVRTPPLSLSPPSSKKKEKKIEVEISGSIAGRKILNKVLPQYPSWAAEKGIEAVITVKIEVEPDGTVRRNLIITGTSGYPQWDNIVKNSVLAWMFAPLPTGSNVIQSGYITFRFVLE